MSSLEKVASPLIMARAKKLAPALTPVIEGVSERYVFTVPSTAGGLHVITVFLGEAKSAKCLPCVAFATRGICSHLIASLIRVIAMEGEDIVMPLLETVKLQSLNKGDWLGEET